MLEKEIEKYLVNRVKAIGGEAYKFVSPGRSGVPDRLICLPGEKIRFVELKATGKEPTPLQCAEHERLKRLGFDVLIIDSMDQVDAIVNWWRELQKQKRKAPDGIHPA